MAVFAATSVVAQDPPAAEGLPEFAAVIAGVIDAQGGREAHEKIKNRTLVGKVIIGEKPRATISSVTDNVGNYLEVLEFDGATRLEEGRNGELAWQRDPVQGARLKRGAEKAQAARLAELHPVLALERHFVERKVEAIAYLGERRCTKLKLVPKEGDPEFWFVGPDFLVARIILKVTSPAGDAELTIDFSDYRAVDGVQLAHRWQIVRGKEKLDVIVEKYSHNVMKSDADLTLPADVEKLPRETPEAKPPEPADKPVERPAGKD